jgi:hypothetical protein
MIDFATYLKLHPESAESRKYRTYAEGLDDEAEVIKEMMDQEGPPPTDIINLFPSEIVGFNLRLKKWGACLQDSLLTGTNNPTINHLTIV